MSVSIINSKEVSWSHEKFDERFERKRKRIGQQLSGSQLGCSIYELPPGKRAFPYHFHYANEELYYILEGEGVVRTLDGEQPVRAGDFISMPASRDGAHQIVSNSESPLRLLALSTMNQPDVVEYIDSEKIFVACGSPPGGDKSERSLTGVWELEDAVDYWKGEIPERD